MLTSSSIGSTTQDPAPTRPQRAEAPSRLAAQAPAPGTAAAAPRVEVERFADVRVLRYHVPGFDELDPRQKELLYYLYEAALSGREIIYDQKYRYNLSVKRTLEEVVKHYAGRPQCAGIQGARAVSEAHLVRERHSSPLLER